MATTCVSVSMTDTGDVIANEVHDTPYDPAANAANPINTTARVHEGSSRVTLDSEGNAVYSGAPITRTTTAPELGEDADILSTARNASGRALTRSEITEDSLVSYGGMQMKVGEAIRLGLVDDRDGYEPGADAPLPSSDELQNTLDDIARDKHATEYGVDANNINAQVLRAAVAEYGDVRTEETVLRLLLDDNPNVDYLRLADQHKSSPEAVQAQLGAAAQAVMNLIVEHTGAPRDSLGAMFDAIKNKASDGEIRSSLRALVTSGDSAPLFKLADKAARDVPMSLEQLQAQGIEAYMKGSEVVIRMEDGSEVSAKVARRLGWI